MAVPLKIYDYVKIPEGTKFTVGSSGLLGDRFVNVVIPSGQPKGYLAPNSFINGARETGMDDLTREGGALVNDLRGTVQKIDTTVTRLNQETLSAQNMENLKASMEHLNQATGALAESSKKLDGVIGQADSAMASAKTAADGLQSAIGDTRKVSRTATQGKGLVATLLNIDNWRTIYTRSSATCAHTAYCFIAIAGKPSKAGRASHTTAKSAKPLKKEWRDELRPPVCGRRPGPPFAFGTT